jgi:hypothetical protein
MKEYSYEIYSLFRLRQAKSEDEIAEQLNRTLIEAVKKLGAVPDKDGFFLNFKSTTSQPPTPLCLRRNLRGAKRQPRSGGIR